MNPGGRGLFDADSLDDYKIKRGYPKTEQGRGQLAAVDGVGGTPKIRTPETIEFLSDVGQWQLLHGAGDATVREPAPLLHAGRQSAAQWHGRELC